jgi:hypothetical protein
MAVSIVLPELTGLREDAVRKQRCRNPKRRGELAEAAFLLKAQSMGFRVASLGETATATILFWIPEGACGGCSVSRSRFLHSRGYGVQPIYGVYGRGKSGYTADDIDVLVVRIVPVDAWYVRPIAAMALAKNLRFYPNLACRCARWEGIGRLGG